VSDLLRTQQAFAAALADPALLPDVVHRLAGDTALVERRLAIYRANVAAAAAKAMMAAYPVVRALVGDEFFGGLTRAYSRAFPSASGDLGDFGQDFASFLQTFEHAQSLPYLPDVARLEWRVHRAYGAVDAGAFDFGALASVPTERQGEIIFRWAAGTAIVASPHPVVQLWRVHQPGFDGQFAVDWSSGEIACIARDGFEVSVSAITTGDAAFIDSSLAGAPFGLACEAALAADPAFDPGRLLQRAIASRLLTGFTLAAPESIS
jgi:hypothetical protein